MSEALEYAPEPCARCGGKGRGLVGLTALPCGRCGGQGSVLVAQPAQKCAKCRGSGTTFWGHCKVCGGCGWAHAKAVAQG